VHLFLMISTQKPKVQLGIVSGRSALSRYKLGKVVSAKEAEALV